MTRTLLATLLAVAAALLEVESESPRRPGVPAEAAARFDASGRLLRPTAYREWIWLSSGLGMSYGPTATGTPSKPPFDNVFVTPAAYRSFLDTGRWPDGTLFVLELRSSETHGSINEGGFFQGGLRGIEVEVRAGGAWTFYGFEPTQAASPAIPRSASCYSCHAAHGAVDNTFVQFYPTLVDVAKAKGTFASAAGSRPD